MLVFSSIPVVNGTLWVLVAFSVITWTMIFYKSWQCWHLKRCNRAFGAAFWNAPDLSQAAKIAADSEAGLARMARAGFQLLAELKAKTSPCLRSTGSPYVLLERCLKQQIQTEQHLLESGLNLLASIGSTSPFVGLFGTVWGIMHALDNISKSGSASLEVVAGPIGEALITTAIGIAVAVPAVLAYNFFLRRAKIYRLEIENFAEDFLHIVSQSEQIEKKEG